MVIKKNKEKKMKTYKQTTTKKEEAFLRKIMVWKRFLTILQRAKGLFKNKKEKNLLGKMFFRNRSKYVLRVGLLKSKN